MAPAPYIRPQMQMSGRVDINMIFLKMSTHPLFLIGDVVLQDARHPCLEMQDDVEFIANDVSMQKGNNT